jgi:hypothetical protein
VRSMNTVANLLRHHVRLLVAAVLLLILPFIAMAPRAAAVEDHSMQSTHAQHVDASLDCATACAQAISTPPTTTIITEDETRTPDPDIQEILPHYPQFHVTPVPKKLCPAALHTTLPGRPPDIVKLSGHFLF